jgi:putative sigma-54 modulation protein
MTPLLKMAQIIAPCGPAARVFPSEVLWDIQVHPIAFWGDPKHSESAFSKKQRRFSMNLTISGHHLEVTPALRGYVTDKLGRITRHFDQVVDVKVILSIENQAEKDRRQKAECNIHVKGNDIFAESAHQDLYAAVDELMDKLDRQVVKHKDRLQSHHHESPKRMM